MPNECICDDITNPLCINPILNPNAGKLVDQGNFTIMWDHLLHILHPNQTNLRNDTVQDDTEGEIVDKLNMNENDNEGQDNHAGFRSILGNYDDLWHPEDLEEKLPKDEEDQINNEIAKVEDITEIPLKNLSTENPKPTWQKVVDYERNTFPILYW